MLRDTWIYFVFFSAFDQCVENYEVYKVETIGDAYVVASGLPERIGERHASSIAAMALNMMALSVNCTLPGSNTALPLRIGINSGKKRMIYTSQ